LDSLIDNLGDSDLSSLIVPDVAMDFLAHKRQTANAPKATRSAPVTHSEPVESHQVDHDAMDVDPPAPEPATDVPAVEEELIDVPGVGKMTKAELAELFADDFGPKKTPSASSGPSSKPTPAKRKNLDGEEDEEEEDEPEDNHQYTGDDWWKVASQIDSAATATAQNADPDGITTGFRSHPPPMQKDGSGVLMYWFDMHEDAYNKPGVLHIFGKVLDEATRKYFSCCVFLQNVDRVLHFAPKTGADMEALKQEVLSLCEAHKIKTIRSKIVSKNYAFEVAGVQHGESQFLELRYPYSEPALPATLTGEHFIHIFGASRSAMETFTLNRQFMGPGWILIKKFKPHDAARTWCRFECSVDSALDIEVVKSENRPAQNPPMTVLSLKIQTVLNPQTRNNEVIAVSLLTKYLGP
jgi:DNA polymerase alpha subunit A